MIAHAPGSDAGQTAQRKDQLRRSALERRSQAGDAAADNARTARLLGLLESAGVAARRHAVATYASIPAEPDTWRLTDALSARGVQVLMPVLRRQPDWAWYAGRDALTSSWHDIPEPTTPRLGAEALATAAAIIVSGLAGAPSGHRVGTGGGWYDRALAFASPSAVTFMPLNDDEVATEVPNDTWDRRVDVIVTPTRTIVTAWGKERDISFPGTA